VRALLRAGLAKDPADRPGVETFLADLERSATEGYGAGWEERGRRRLAELATLLALLFPFTTTATLEGSASALTLLGRLKRGGWKMATGGVAALVVVGGGATYATGRPHETSTTVASSTPSPVNSPAEPGTSPSASTSPTAAPPPTADAPPSNTPSDGPSSSSPPSPATSPTAEPPATASPSAATPGTVTLTIGSWQRGQKPGTLIAAVTVETTGTGPLTVTANYYVDTPADPYGSQSQPLSGSTRYDLTFEADFSNHPCRGTWDVTLSSDPAAANGPQTASLDAPPC
jgi:serine/threonine-protein kinase